MYQLFPQYLNFLSARRPLANRYGNDKDEYIFTLIGGTYTLYMHPDHVVRMPENRLPKRIMYSELTVGKRSHGGQREWYKDTLKAALKMCRIDPDSWEKLCLDRDKWRAKVKHGTKEFEERRIEDAKRKRQDRKERARSDDVAGHIPCPKCPRMFRARIGLISHLKTHA